MGRGREEREGGGEGKGHEPPPHYLEEVYAYGAPLPPNPGYATEFKYHLKQTLLMLSTYIRLKAMFRAASFGGQFAILVVACHLYFLFFRYYFYFIWQIKYVLCSVKCKRSFEHHL